MVPAEGKRLLSDYTAVHSNVDKQVGLLPAQRENMRQEPRHYTPKFGPEVPIEGLIRDGNR